MEETGKQLDVLIFACLNGVIDLLWRSRVCCKSMHIFSWVLFIFLELFFTGIFRHLWVKNCSLLLLTRLFVLLSFKSFLLLVLTLLLLFVIFAWLILSFFFVFVLCADVDSGNHLLEFSNVDWMAVELWKSWLEILVVPSGIR